MSLRYAQPWCVLLQGKSLVSLISVMIRLQAGPVSSGSSSVPCKVKRAFLQSA